MIGHGVSRNFASRLCLADDGGKVSPFRVAQKVLEIAAKPILDAAFRLLGMSFKSAGQQLDRFAFQSSPSGVDDRKVRAK